MVLWFQRQEASELEAVLERHTVVPERGAPTLQCCTAPHGRGMKCAQWPCM